jgi:glycosyltransferase involved in cell wall biosynthesis
MYKVLLLSPYDGLSHQYWRQGLTGYLAEKAPEFSIDTLVLPPRYFSWRQRGNSLSFSGRLDDTVVYDLIIATSLTDLSALRGLQRSLATTPALIYFHENQFAYPDHHEKGLLERQLTSIYTALSADWLFFNSQFNLSTFLGGARELLAKMPDEVPSGVLDSIASKASVVPVALEPLTVKPRTASKSNVLKIVWNHRLEHDKGPAVLKSIVDVLLTAGLRFEFSLLGQEFRGQPEEFSEITTQLAAADSLGRQGFIEDRQAYLEFLGTQDVVLSTALQEFQGLAVQEAISCGCVPLVPDALCYPEYVAGGYRYSTPAEAIAILERLSGDGLIGYEPDLSACQWENVGPLWLEKLKTLLH